MLENILRKTLNRGKEYNVYSTYPKENMGPVQILDISELLTENLVDDELSIR
jgi:hypothetical protein